jgi:hypothetical protein
MVAVAAFLVVVHATRELDRMHLTEIIAILYGQPHDTLDAVAQRVFGAPLGQLGPRALPARINVVATATESLLHGYECAISYKNKLNKERKETHLRLPFDKQGPANYAELLQRAVRYANEVGHPELAVTLAQEGCNPFVALCLYVAQRTFLPPLRESLRRLAEPLEFAAWYSARAANSPKATPRQREVMQLKWLQALGLPREDCDVVREWCHSYALLPLFHYYHGPCPVNEEVNNRDKGELEEGGEFVGDGTNAESENAIVSYQNKVQTKEPEVKHEDGKSKCIQHGPWRRGMMGASTRGGGPSRISARMASKSTTPSPVSGNGSMNWSLSISPCPRASWR